MIEGYECPVCAHQIDLEGVEYVEDGTNKAKTECPSCGVLIGLIETGDDFDIIATLADWSKNHVIEPMNLRVSRTTDGEILSFFEIVLVPTKTKTASRSGNACHVYVPAEWEGQDVKVHKVVKEDE